MPLGRQFRNTFWHDADGTVRASETVEGMPGSPVIHEMPAVRPEGTNHLQGMLFSPYDATGLKGDSLAGDRRAAISTSLGLDDLGKYRERLGRMVRGQKVESYVRDDDGKIVTDANGSMKRQVTSKRGDKGAREDIERIIGSVDHTDLPTHIIRGVNAPTVLDPSPGRAYAEDHSGRIRLTTHVRGGGGHWEGGDTVTQPKVTRGEPLVNKNFHRQVRTIDWDSFEGAHHDMITGGSTGGYRMPTTKADVHFYHHETGEEIHPDPEMKDGEGQFSETPMHANVWPGSGKDTDKYVTSDFKVYDGYNSRTGGDRYRTFHTRHARVVSDETEETTTPRKFVKDKTIRTTNPATAVHEIGHVRDEATVDSFSHRRALRHTADPREEGIADGHADRFVRHAGKFEETLDPDFSGRAEEIKSGGGYGTDYHHWKGDKVGKALYAATRAHAAMSDDGAASIPGRDDLAKRFGLEEPRGMMYRDTAKETVNIGDKVLLGHLYHEHEHVRRALGNLGMKDVGEDAHRTYQHLVDRETPKPEEKWTQYPMIQQTTGQQWVRM